MGCPYRHESSAVRLVYGGAHHVDCKPQLTRGVQEEDDVQGTKLKLKQYEQPGELVTLDSGTFSSHTCLSVALQSPDVPPHALLSHEWEIAGSVHASWRCFMQLQDPVATACREQPVSMHTGIQYRELLEGTGDKIVALGSKVSMKCAPLLLRSATCTVVLHGHVVAI